MNTEVKPNREKVVSLPNGWLMLPLVLLWIIGSLLIFIWSISAGVRVVGHPYWTLFVAGILAEIAGLICLGGFFTLQPNEARVLVLVGAYVGTVRTPGFYWGNPFYANGNNQGFFAQALDAQAQLVAARAGTAAPNARRRMSRFKLSLRARNFNSERLKVNDKRGNPIEIAAVVVWKIEDTAQAMFDVEDFENYVRVQSESAVRHLASAYAYDHGEDQEVTLRSGV